jgi:hypothetical protein
LKFLRIYHSGRAKSIEFSGAADTGLRVGAGDDIAHSKTAVV